MSASSKRAGPGIPSRARGSARAERMSRSSSKRARSWRPGWSTISGRRPASSMKRMKRKRKRKARSRSIAPTGVPYDNRRGRSGARLAGSSPLERKFHKGGKNNGLHGKRLFEAYRDGGFQRAPAQEPFHVVSGLCD